MKKDATDLIVVGGGLAGLTAATIAARRGARVTLFERSRNLGGRAMTARKEGFHFNLGAHALNCKGPAAVILEELGVSYYGDSPRPRGGYAILDGRKRMLPAGLISLLSTDLLDLPGKMEAARFMASLGTLDSEPFRHMSIREWLTRTLRHPEVRELVAAFLRLATYADEPERQSAGSALAQLQRTIEDKVLYVDGGWQTLVDGLRLAAERAGVSFVIGARVDAVERAPGPNGRVRGLRLADGRAYEVSSMILATGPKEAAAIVERREETPLPAWAASRISARAACLGLGLDRLPNPGTLFATGLDRPLYFSVHSAAARLAPEGAALVHAARYLRGDEPVDSARDRRELEEMMDLVQPGWRDLVRVCEFLPAMTVTNAVALASEGGTQGRPGPDVPGAPGLYVAGDWVGPDGMLADAAVASGKRAAELALDSRAAVARAA